MAFSRYPRHTLGREGRKEGGERRECEVCLKSSGVEWSAVSDWVQAPAAFLIRLQVRGAHIYKWLLQSEGEL